MNITVIGTTFVDIKGYPQGHYVPTGRNAGAVEYFHGGVARNVAEDVAALGEKVSFVSLVDNNGTGIDVVNRLKEKGICTDFVCAEDGGMGTWLAIFDEQGEISANISKRPDLLSLSELLLRNEAAIFENSDGIFLEIDIDAPVVETVFSLARKHNVPVYSVISNATAAKERMPYILRSRCFICNKAESVELFGLDFSEDNKDFVLDDLDLLRKMLSIPNIVVTMDSEGAIFASESECGSCPAESVEVVDTTGAGDAFFAGTCTALVRGEKLSEACKLGTKLAANVISSKENVYNG